MSLIFNHINSLFNGNYIFIIILAIILGLFCATICTIQDDLSNSFFIALSIMPALIYIALIVINGNLGTAIATLGVFSLIRFRSNPGNAKEIISIFYAMSIGFLLSTNQFILTITITMLLGFVILIIEKMQKIYSKNSTYKLIILIPENSNFEGKFDSILSKYFSSFKLQKVKSTNMGTLFELSYVVKPFVDIKTKDMLDEIRQENNNLNVIYCLDDTGQISL